MNLLFLCPIHSSPMAPNLVFGMLTEALHQDHPDAKVSDHMEITGSLSMDADHGWETVRALTSYHEVDSVICFGKSSASFGLPDIEPLYLTHIRLPRRFALTSLVRLPSPLSSWWSTRANAEDAVTAVKPLLYPPPVAVRRPHIAWDGTAWN